MNITQKVFITGQDVKLKEGYRVVNGIVPLEMMEVVSYQTKRNETLIHDEFILFEKGLRPNEIDEIDSTRKALQEGNLNSLKDDLLTGYVWCKRKFLNREQTALFPESDLVAV